MRKKIAYLAIVLFVATSSFAQDLARSFNLETGDEIITTRNEIRVNLLTSVMGYPEITYERFLESNFSLGFSAMASLESPERQSLRAAFIPYARLYFSHNVAAGFYIEASTGVVNNKYYKYDEYYPVSSDYSYKGKMISSTNVGIGVAIGYKFLAKNNWVGDVFGGAGRVFGNDYVDAYPRVGIAIGKRF